MNETKYKPIKINFTEEEYEKLPERIETACEMIKSFCLAGIQYTMNLYNKKKL